MKSNYFQRSGVYLFGWFFSPFGLVAMGINLVTDLEKEKKKAQV